MSDFRTAVITHFVKGTPAGLARQEAATGRFLDESGGFAQTNQDVQLALATLYTNEHEANPYYLDGKLLDAISRAGDALRNGQDAEGQIEFIKVDGSRWGWSYMAWPLYHWLETYALMREHLDPACRAQWEEGLTLAYGGVRKRIAEGQLHLHNIPAWLAMGMARAGTLFGRDEWIQAGLEFVRRFVDTQHPEGYWPEGLGPTPSYNRVYIHALGLQYGFFRDPALLPALERALEFHLHFTYPDGTNVETIDGRVRYRDEVSGQGWAGFVHFPKGRKLIHLMMNNLLLRKPEGGLEPHVASGFLGWADETEEPIPQTMREFASNYHGHALVRRKGPWFICLNGYLMSDEAMDKSYRVRWHLDRQNYISIWHEKTGLIVGGGNSKHHPDFSTFSMVQGRTRWNQAETVRLEQDDEQDTATYTYGDFCGTVMIRVLSDAKVEILFKAEGKPCENLVALFTMPLKAGSRISSSGDEEQALDPMSVWGASWSTDDASADQWVAGEGWRLHAPLGGSFRWPVYPYNPYAINDAGAENQAVATAFASMKPGEEKRFVLEVVD